MDASESPRSSSEALSGSASPQIIKHVHTKQRLSSINSDTHLTHQRSMSIISLGLPRNSIVSIDDFFLRPTRNNSSASLTLLAPVSLPSELNRDHYVINRHKVRKNASAIVSDEDSEGECHTSRLRWRRRLSDKVQKPSFLSSLKKDFKFKYDHSSPKVAPAPPVARAVDDLVALPLLLALDAAESAFDEELPHTKTLGKKLRTSSMSQSMFFKKKLLLSKDIQLELRSGYASSPTASPAVNVDTRFPFPTLSLPLPTRGTNNYLSDSATSQSCPPRTSPSPPLAAPQVVLPTSHSTPPTSDHSVKRQNKLIYELNQKWNRAMFPAVDLGKSPPRKKRGRSELVSSNDG